MKKGAKEGGTVRKKEAKKKGGLLKKLADAREGLQIKLAHAGVGSGKSSVDTQTNDALIAGAEETTALVLAQYRQIQKAGKTAADRQDQIIKAGNTLARQFRGCAELSDSQCGEFLQRVARFRESECEMDALLMNGFSNGLSLALDDFCNKQEKKLKNSRARYDHALSDYGVAVRKAQVRLGKGPQFMDPTRYLKAAVGREICLQNFEQVTSEHLAEHRTVEESKNIEVYMEFFRAQESQIRYMASLDKELAELKVLAKNVTQWARSEKEQQQQRLLAAQRDDFVEEEARLWESHDDFVRFMATPNMLPATCLLKTEDSPTGAPNDELLARAFDSWGLSESLWMEVLSRNPWTDDSLALFAGQKWLERLLHGYIRVHFSDWFDDCWKPMLDRLTSSPDRFALGKPQGMSALLRLTEEVIERMYDTMGTFSPLFARMCSVPGVTAPLMGGCVFKMCLLRPELFGYTRLPESCRVAADVLAWILWEILRGRRFAAIDASQAQRLKLNVTVAHHVTENVEMLRSWSSSLAVQQMTKMFASLGANSPPMPAIPVEGKLASVRAGGDVYALVAHCRLRQDQMASLLLDHDRAVFFKYTDLFQKAAVASERGEKRANEEISPFISGENSLIEDSNDTPPNLDEDLADMLKPQRRRGGELSDAGELPPIAVPKARPTQTTRALVSPRPTTPENGGGGGGRFLPPPRKNISSASSPPVPTSRHSRSKSAGDFTKPARPAPPRSKPSREGSASNSPGPAPPKKPSKPVPRAPRTPAPEKPAAVAEPDDLSDEDTPPLPPKRGSHL